MWERGVFWKQPVPFHFRNPFQLSTPQIINHPRLPRRPARHCSLQGTNIAVTTGGVPALGTTCHVSLVTARVMINMLIISPSTHKDW
jgi:hypothetical protein